MFNVFSIFGRFFRCLGQDLWESVVGCQLKRDVIKQIVS